MSHAAGMNYVAAFIAVADDCPARTGTVPPTKPGQKRTVAAIQYAMLADAPYRHTQEDLLFGTYAAQQGLSAAELDERGAALRADYFAIARACLRASPLPKRYGWGLHFDDAGRIALYPVDSVEYRAFVAGEAGDLKVMKAMRSRRG